MDDTIRCQPAALRAKLLLGVAGAVAATSSAALGDQMPQPAPDKWVPYTDIGGGYGSGMTAGKADAFVPIWQNASSLLFGNLGIGTETKTNQFENFGLGYRTKINPDWILGGYAGFDSTQLQDNNTFNQTSLGAELMSAEWDVRLNGYIAANEAKTHQGQSSLYISGTTIAVMDAQDAGYTGFDGEVGYRVFSTDNTDVRLFIGGFMFGHVDSKETSLGESFDIPYRDIAGPKARAELTVYDLDILGPQSRLTLDGEVAHDDVRGTTGYVGATLRIPLGDFGGGAQALDELDRRMADPERRNDTVLTRASYTKPEPVIIYGPHVTSQPTNTLLYVDNTQGVGTYANPTTFADAASRSTTNAFIVITSKQGPVSTAGVTLQPGQTVVPGGQTFTVEGEFSHAKFVHDFDAATNVTLVSTNPNANVITLASNSTVYDVAIEGSFANAIYGKNVKNVDISHVTIDGTGAGTGIDIVGTATGSQKVTIANTTISDTDVGIRLNTAVSGHGSTTNTFNLSNVAVSNTASDGIVIDTYAGAGAKITSNVSLSNVSVTGAGGDGIDIYTHANGTGASISQTLTMSNATVSGAGKDGIIFDTYAQSAAAIASVAALSSVSVTNSGTDGIYVERNATGTQSSVAQVFAGSGIMVSGSNGDGIALDATAKAGGTIQANDSLASVTDTGAHGYYSSGISVSTVAKGAGSAVIQALSIANATVSASGQQGVYVAADAQSGAHITATVSMANVTATGAAEDGILVHAGSYGGGSSLTETVSLANISAVNAGVNDVSFFTYADNGGHITDNVTLANVTASSAQEFDLRMRAIAYGTGSSIAQDVVASNVTVTGATYSDVFLFNQAEYGGLINSNVTFSNLKASNSGNDGLEIFTIADGSGTVIDQTVAVTNPTITNVSDDGIGISTAALYGAAQITSTVSLSNVTVSGAHNEGVYVYTSSYGLGASTNQALTLSHVSVANAGSGVFVSEYAGQGGHTTAHDQLSNVTITGATTTGVSFGVGAYDEGSVAARTLSLSNASVSNAGLLGVSVGASARNGGQISDGVTLSNITVSDTGEDGVYVRTVAYNTGSTINQAIAISNATITGSGQDGIGLLTRAKYGAAIQGSATLSGITVSGASHDGIYAKTIAYDVGSVVDQTLAITTAAITDPGKDGIGIMTRAKYGATIDSEATLSGVTLSGPQRDGVYVYTQSTGAGTSTYQALTISNATVTGPGVNGIFVLDYAAAGGRTTGSLNLSGITIANGQHDGFDIRAIANGSGSIVDRTLILSDVTLTDPGAFGIYLDTYAAGGAQTTSHATVSNATVSGAGSTGIFVSDEAKAGGQVDSTATLSNIEVSGTGLRGVELYGSSYGAGSVVNQTFALTNATITNPTYNGIVIITDAVYGAETSSIISLSNIAVSGGQDHGLFVYAGSYGAGAPLYQSLALSQATITNTGSRGVFVTDTAYLGGQITADESLTNVAVTGTTSVGMQFDVASYDAGSVATRTLTLSDVSVTDAGASGIDVDAAAIGGGAVGDGVLLSNVTATQNGIVISVGAYGSGSTARQTVAATNSTVTNPGQDGIVIQAHAATGGMVTSNATLSGITVSGPSRDGIYVYTESLAGGTSLYQTLAISNATISGAGVDGIHIFNQAQIGAASAVHDSLSNITVTGGTYAGIQVWDLASYGARAKQYVTVAGATISNVSGSFISYGLHVQATSLGGAAYAYQSTTVSNVAVSYISGDTFSVGIGIDAVAQTGGALVQNVSIANSSAAHGDIGLRAFAEVLDTGLPEPTTSQQTVTVNGSTFSNNTSQGIQLTNEIDAALSGYHSLAVSNQTASISNTTADYDGTGIFISDAASHGASINQNVSLYGVQVEHSVESGVAIVASAYTRGVAGQYVTVGGSAGSDTVVGLNGGAGIFFVGNAGTGGQVEQRLSIYHANVDNNVVYGLSAGGNANGYYGQSVHYVSRVRQTVTAAYNTISNNGGSGIEIADNASYEGRVFGNLYLTHDTIDHNARYGLIDLATITSPTAVGTTNVNQNVRIQYSDLSYNGGGAGAAFDTSITRTSSGLSYVSALQYITIDNATFTHNGTNGFSATITDNGVLTLGRQFITITDSEFSQNSGDGIHLSETQTGSVAYGSLQDVTINSSDLSHNVGRGLYAKVGGYGQGSVARQYITVAGSTFDYNGKSGIRLARYAENGTYVAGHPCNAAQYPGGGCAVVIATFGMNGGSVSNNGAAGLNIANYANNFGSIYAINSYYAPLGQAHYPTVVLTNVALDHNQTIGLVSATTAKNHSSVYSYIDAHGGTADHNSGDGFIETAITYSGSSIVDRNTLYAVKANYNGQSGIWTGDYALGGSTITATNTLSGGVTASHNAGYGVSLSIGEADATSHVYQNNVVRNGQFYNNGNSGAALYAFGSGASHAPGQGQHSKLYANSFSGNTRYALYGKATSGAYQFIGYQTYGNQLNGGATKFVAASGGAQVVQ